MSAPRQKISTWAPGLGSVRNFVQLAWREVPGCGRGQKEAHAMSENPIAPGELVPRGDS
jgi:hypothetical protein